MATKTKQAPKLPTKRIPAYVALRAAALAVGWPKSFTKDLTVHDHGAIARRTSRKGETPVFLWALYESGTHLVWEHEPIGTEIGRNRRRSGGLTGLIAAVATEYPTAKWHVWDGLALHVCATAQGALDLLEQMHESADEREKGGA